MVSPSANAEGEEIGAMNERRRVRIADWAIVSHFATFAIVMVILGAWSSPGFAFGGCTQASPENPSLILGLLGGVVAAFPMVRAWLKSRLRK
jgi:hypothetical protein